MSPGDKALPCRGGRGAMPARLIGRAGNEIGIETIYNEGLAAVWFAQMPFGPALRERTSVFASEEQREKRKLDSLSLDVFLTSAFH